MTNMGPHKTYTLEEFAKYGGASDELMYYNFSIIDLKVNKGGEPIQFEVDNVVNDYLDLLKENSVEVTLTDKDKSKYFYNPELLSFDLYGTTELDFVLMKINGILDPKEFDMAKLKVVYPSVLKEMLSNIYNAEMKFINLNREKNKG